MSRYLPVSIAMTSRTTKGQLPLPPYARQLLARLERGEPLNVWAFGGSRAWEEAAWHNKYFGPASTLMLPPGDSPHAYQWPVDGLEMMLVWLDGTRDQLWQDITRDQLIEFGTVLIQNGASLVVAPYSEDPEGFLFFRPKPSERAVA